MMDFDCSIFGWHFNGVFGLAVLAGLIYCMCRIIRKMGWHWAYGLLVLVPVVNVILFVYLTFVEWPVERRLRFASEAETHR